MKRKAILLTLEKNSVILKEKTSLKSKHFDFLLYPKNNHKMYIHNKLIIIGNLFVEKDRMQLNIPNLLIADCGLVSYNYYNDKWINSIDAIGFHTLNDVIFYIYSCTYEGE